MRVTTVGAFLCAAAASFIAGCMRPSVDTFSATPPHLCAGGTVHLEWTTTNAQLDGVSLRASPSAPPIVPLSPVAPDGSLDVAIDVTTTFTVVADATALPRIEEQRTVVVLNEPMAEALTIVPTCGPSGMPTWDTVVSESDFPIDIEVRAGVLNFSERTVRITHEGVTATVGPREMTNEFNGLVFAGRWSVAVPLESTESCPPAQSSDPGTTPTLPSTTISVFAGCAPM